MKIHPMARLCAFALATIPAARAAVTSGAAQSGPVVRPTQHFYVNVPRMPLRAMAYLATDVALVRIEGSRTHFPNAGVASTVYSAVQLSSLKGSQRTRLEIQVGGARSDSQWVLVDGAPVFEPGQEVLLFLWTDPASGETGVLGLERGVYRVAKGEDGTRRVQGDHAQGLEMNAFLDQVALAWLEALELHEGAQQEDK